MKDYCKYSGKQCSERFCVDIDCGVAKEFDLLYRQQKGMENKFGVVSSEIHLDGTPRPADNYSQQNKANKFHEETHGEKLSGKSYSSGELGINLADIYSPNKSDGMVHIARETALDTLKQVQTGSDNYSQENKTKLCATFEDVMSGARSELSDVGMNQQVGANLDKPLDNSYSCSHINSCANSSDKCRDSSYRDTCPVKSDFQWGKHGVGF